MKKERQQGLSSKIGKRRGKRGQKCRRKSAEEADGGVEEGETVGMEALSKGRKGTETTGM